jgi:hypothetical protein
MVAPLYSGIARTKYLSLAGGKILVPQSWALLVSAHFNGMTDDSAHDCLLALSCSTPKE